MWKWVKSASVLQCLYYCFLKVHLEFSIFLSTCVSIGTIRSKPFLYARLQTGRIMVWWCLSVHPSVRPSGSPSVSHSFPHFSPTCFDILSWNFACHFLLMNIRSSSSVVNFRPFLLELWPFSNLKYWKYIVFCSFLLHALTYWAKILHMTLFCCTTDQVRVLSISVHLCRSYAPFGT